MFDVMCSVEGHIAHAHRLERIIITVGSLKVKIMCGLFLLTV